MPAARPIKAGDKIGPCEWRPTTVQLFRFSAVTWNPHRIHYDRPYAIEEGYPDVLVQSHLHGCFLAHTALTWAGRGARLVKFRWENRHFAIPGDVLTCGGVVSGMNGDLVHCELEEVNQDGRLCAPAWATVQLAWGHKDHH
jgi:hydroxyacyl-ACP dehydratase HTD2-like protein with hotdog domain